MPVVNIPGVGDVVLVDRQQLRFTRHGRSFSAPAYLQEVAATLPTPPATFDHSKSEALKFPMLGNDQVGDCFYAAVEHASQCNTGNVGIECQFDTAATIK